VEERGANVEPAPPRSFFWRTFWIYAGFGPPIGSTVGLLLYMVPLIDARTRDAFTFTFEGMISIVFTGYLVGLIVGGLPAALTGLAAARLHYDGEPIWRAVALGIGLGALTSLAWWMTLNGFHAPTVEVLVSVTAIGAFAGAVCALIQRNKSTPRRNG